MPTRSALATTLCVAALAPVTPAAHAQSNPGDAVWTTTFLDEFTGPANSAPNPAVWNIEQGGGGWGNNELQTYTDRAANVSLDGNGHLRLTARAETYTGHDGIQRDYTSARITTQGKFNQAFGRFEATLQTPTGQGLWPAFWMLGEDIASDGWPASGEIDVMELIGSAPSTVHGTIHGPGYSAGDSIGASYTAPGGASFADAMHTVAVEWTPNRIDWLVDGNLYQTRTPADLAGDTWVFDDEFFLLLNVAVGGNWPGSPDASTSFPQAMLVDSVRVSERSVVTRSAVENPGFTQGNQAWDLMGNAYVESHDLNASPQQTAIDGPGDSALKLFGTFDPNAGGTQATQPFQAITPGEPVTLSAAVRTNSDDAIAGTDNQLILFIAWYDGYDQHLGGETLLALDGSSPTDQWLNVSLDTVPIDGAAYANVGVIFNQPNSATGAAWVDAVAFGPTPVPEPASAALLLATGALTLTRRRR